jgi:hypothetical protein
VGTARFPFATPPAALTRAALFGYDARMSEPALGLLAAGSFVGRAVHRRIDEGRYRRLLLPFSLVAAGAALLVAAGR